MNTTQNQTMTRPRVNGSAVLWASAFVIFALAIVQAGRLGPMSAADAGDVALIRDLTILTAASGNDEDILLILDTRAQTLYIYGPKNRNSVELFGTHKVGDLFENAARAYGGGRRP